MRGSLIPASACLMVALAACGPAQNPVSPTLPAPVDNTPAASTSAPTKVSPIPTPSGPVGSISGNILPTGYPQPATSLKIFAREKDAGTVFSADVAVDATSYTISNIPPGVYNVFAWYYSKGLAGAYTMTSTNLKTATQIIIAGNSSDQFTCTNSLVDITIAAGKMDFQGADLACWGGDFFSYIPLQP
jgi:hypothetical protein